MSEAVSVMNGARFDGAVVVADAGLRGMITLRGDLGDEKLAAAVKSAVGLAMPARRAIRTGKRGAVAWMSPDELLLFVDYDKSEEIATRIGATCAGTHHLAVNVSDARAVFTLAGAGVREVLAKGAPADLSPEGLPAGEIRRTRLGQIAAAFWLTSETEATVVCFRSVGAHLFHWLANAAKPGTLPGVL